MHQGTMRNIMIFILWTLDMIMLFKEILHQFVQCQILKIIGQIYKKLLPSKPRNENHVHSLKVLYQSTNCSRIGFCSGNFTTMGSFPRISCTNYPDIMKYSKIQTDFCFFSINFFHSGGIASTMIKYQKSQDGKLAWLTLKNWYERQGSKNSIVCHAMKNFPRKQ